MHQGLYVYSPLVWHSHPEKATSSGGLKEKNNILLIEACTDEQRRSVYM